MRKFPTEIVAGVAVTTLLVWGTSFNRVGCVVAGVLTQALLMFVHDMVELWRS